jgi:L-malate glycosyltransferase
MQQRVLHFSTGKTFRGGERQVQYLHEGLLQRGIESLLICPDNGAFAGSEMQGLSQIRWNSEWDMAGLLRLVRLCKEKKPTIIHCHDGHSLLHGALASMICGIPLVSTRRVIWPIGANPLTRWKYSRCRALIAVSHAVEKQCISAFGAKPVIVVHDGVRWQEDEPDRRAARMKLGIPAECFCVATVGHFTNEKNIGLVAEVGQFLAANHRDVRLALIGPADEALRRRMSGGGNIIFCGMVADPQQYYRAFNVYISPSRAEGLGTALLDALVRDIPTVATDAGGTRELYPEGHALPSPDDCRGFIAILGQTIQEYDNAVEHARALGVQARERFSIDRMVDGCVSIYRKILITR